MLISPSIQNSWTLLNIFCLREMVSALRYGIGIFIPLTYLFKKIVLLGLLTSKMHGPALFSSRHNVYGLYITTKSSYWNPLKASTPLKTRKECVWRSRLKSRLFYGHTKLKLKKNINLILYDMLQMNQACKRRDTADFSSNTWDEDVIIFRQCLIRIARCVG